MLHVCYNLRGMQSVFITCSQRLSQTKAGNQELGLVLPFFWQGRSSASLSASWSDRKLDLEKEPGSNLGSLTMGFGGAGCIPTAAPVAHLMVNIYVKNVLLSSLSFVSVNSQYQELNG